MTRPTLRPIAYPVMFAAGAILGTFWDQLHVQAHALVYQRGGLFAGQPFWVPLEFGAAFAAGGALFVLLGDLAPRRSSAKVAALEAVWLTAVYATTAFGDRRPWILFGVLVVTLAARADPLSAVLASATIPALTLVVAGCIVESMLISADVFHYRTSQLGPIPAWLPLLYANAIVFSARSAEAALQLFGRRRALETAAGE